MMTENSFYISGYIKNRENKAVPNLRVEAWDKDLFFDDFLAETVTDEDGRFSLSFSADRFEEFFFDKCPDLYFKIKKGPSITDEIILDTSNSILWNVASGITELEQPVIVDVPFGEEPEPQVSHRFPGRLLNEKTLEPLPDFIIRALDLDVGEQPVYLGYDITNSQGLFIFTYTTPAQPEDAAQRRHFRLQISVPNSDPIHETDIEVVVDSTEAMNVMVPSEALP